MTDTTKQYSTELKTLDNHLSTYQQTIIEIERLGKLDPNLSNKTKLQQLNARLKKLKSQLGEGEKEFVSANKMASLLTDMLNQNNALKLISLENITRDYFIKIRPTILGLPPRLIAHFTR